jgi:hypothetical protein
MHFDQSYGIQHNITWWGSWKFRLDTGLFRDAKKNKIYIDMSHRQTNTWDTYHSASV